MTNPIARHRTYYEGDDDGSVLEALAAAGLLPTDLDIVQRDNRRKNPGKEGMVKDIAALVNPAGGAGRSAVAIRDMDELSAAQVAAWFTQRMSVELPQTTPPVQIIAQPGTAKTHYFHIEAAGTPHVGRVVVVPVGLPASVAATEYEIGQFAVDDHLLLLARDKSIYDSISEFGEVSHDLALKKLAEIVALMKGNGIPVKHTKRLMHLFRAVTGFRASPATFAERLVSQGIVAMGAAGIRNFFLPLIEGLEEASRPLSP